MGGPEVEDEGVGRSAIVKMSWRILPLIAVSYAIAYMDRVNISFAAARMNEDLHFSATVYGLGGGLFFITYALLEVPSNLLLVRFGARRWIARIMLTWGVLAVAMMFVRTPAQFYTVRLLLGAAEAGFFPGVILYLTRWFSTAYRSRAISRFYVAVPLVSVVMGAVAGALLDLDGRLGLAGWQWLFLVQGLPAVLMSGVILFFLPESPATVSWLTGEEKAWIAKGFAQDKARLGDEAHGFLQALLHPAVLLLGANQFLVLGAFYAFNLSAPILLDEATHLGATKVGYLVAVGGLAGATTLVVNAWHADRTRERFWHVALPMVAMAISFAVLGHVRQPALVMAAYIAAMASAFAVNAVFWSLPGELLPASSTAVSSAAINSIGQLGSFFAPFAWGLAKDYTGDFRAGVAVMPIGYLVAATIILFLGWRVGALGRRRRTA